MSKTIRVFAAIAVLCGLASSGIIAQPVPPSRLIKRSDGGEININFTKNQLPGNQNPTELMISMGLIGPDDELRLLRSDRDETGMTHSRYQQYYRGVPVEGAQLIVHAHNGWAVNANGNIFTGIKIPATPAISEQQALEKALGEVRAKQYDLQQRSNTNDKPGSKLVIVQDKSGNHRLAYSVIDIVGEYRVFIDAADGSVIKKYSLTKNLYPVPGWIPLTLDDNTLYDGVRRIEISGNQQGLPFGWWRYGLIDQVNNISTRDKNGSYCVVDPPFGNFPDPYVQVHWAAEMTKQYFKDKFNRNSFDGDGGEMINVVNPNHHSSTFYPSLKESHFGISTPEDGGRWRVSLDCVGHEWTHAYTGFYLDPQYGYGFQKEENSEQRALDESFSDIFGTMIEYYAYNNNAGDYWFEEDLAIPPYGALRCLFNPKTCGDPDTYGGLNWYKDGGNCHYQCGVQNYWFFCLAEGSGLPNYMNPGWQYTNYVNDGVNDNGNPYYVTGIGREKAAKIAYENFAHYLVPSSNYAASRRGSIMAAVYLYGLLSNEALQTAKAWYAVGVGDTEDLKVSGFNVTEWIDSHVGQTIEVSNYHVFPSIYARALMYAGKRIKLEPGFHVSEGGKFRATINTVPWLAGAKAEGEATEGAGNEPESTSARATEILPEVKSTLCEQNMPNPFSSTTAIRYALKDNARVSLNVYNALGQRVRTLIDEQRPAGHHSVNWDGKNDTGQRMSRGIYILRFTAGDYAKSYKTMLIR